ncbi:NAD(P)H-dependent oxidoreductase [Alkalibacterium iburiense]|uniref:NAD(P)H-dependent oxidoreductase n=1 Tax=Alkalibacterium iburiense TaxID=290589 RepID=A0ABN0X8Q7_9LACT
MKTLVIISHPELEESGSQQFLVQAVDDLPDVTLHHLEGRYPDGKIDVKAEQALLRQYDRILFQFPFYWYSSPPLLKKWQDDVLTEHFAFGYRGDKLNGKDFGMVLVIGLPEKDYQTGGAEGFSISELTKPFQAMAKKVGMDYVKPLTIFQFPYKTEEEKMDLLIQYRQYLSMKNPDSLKSREEWLLKELDQTNLETLPEDQASFILEEVVELIEDNRMELDELRLHIDNYED